MSGRNMRKRGNGGEFKVVGYVSEGINNVNVGDLETNSHALDSDLFAKEDLLLMGDGEPVKDNDAQLVFERMDSTIQEDALAAQIAEDLKSFCLLLNHARVERSSYLYFGLLNNLLNNPQAVEIMGLGFKARLLEKMQ